MQDYTIAVHEQHRRMLAASGISPDQAHARDYKTITTKVHLERLGITSSGRRVPGLLVPMRRIDGSEWGYQYRPDSPRERGGKPVKYETPTGQRNGIDFPPGVRPMLANLRETLMVTEGTKKADAAVQRGLCCIALPGVWSWKGKPGNDPHEATVAVADWDDVGLKGRGVVLAFDSDVMVKASVRKALDRLARFLLARGVAEVRYLVLPDTGDGKTGLDDFLAEHDVSELGQYVHKVTPEPVAEEFSSGSAGSATSSGSSETPRETGDPVPVETGQLLGDVRRWLARYVRTMHDADLDVLTLWAAHTHVVHETYTTPRLVLDSPVPGSGKTTVLEHLQRLCFDAVQMASLGSPALLTRMLDKRMRTILIDEADRTLNPDKEGVGELLAVLNSGYKRGATRPVLVPTKDGWEDKEMPTYSPVVMAGNNPNLPEDTRSRTIRVLLLPDLDGTVEESDWEMIEDDARELGERLARWAEQIREQIRTHRPPLPEGVTGRARERWSPLKRVAAAAGGRWPDVVDALAVADLARIVQDREDGMVRDRPAVILLRDVHDIWPEGETFFPTEKMLAALVAHNPDTWGAFSAFGKELTPQRLGRMLVTSYNLHSSRPDTNGPRGYVRAAIEPVWQRMGHPRENLDTPLGYAIEDGPSPVLAPLLIEPDEPAEPAEPDAPADDPTRCGTCGNRLHGDRCIRCEVAA